MSTLFNSPYKYLFLTSLFLYLVTAFFSEGYYHPDEHFQILEFCNYKLGLSPSADLPWEFKERIRPALQPACAWVVIQFLRFVHISNPFTWALILRLISALLSWLITSKIILYLINDFSNERSKKIFIYLNFFLWFVPLISVRFSSENFAGITFLSAVYLILQYLDKKSARKLLPLAMAGLLLGFSFYFRFQMAFAVIGLGLWLVFINKMKALNLFIFIISGFCAILVCTYLDYWFYGKLEVTPVNYFIANIIEHKAAHWGVLPWWSYFSLFIIKAVPPISVLLLFFFVIGMYRSRTNIFTWCFIPFLLAHFVVGHKEIRFMFPMIVGFIYIAVTGIDYFISSGRWRKTGRFLFIFSFIINVPLLLIISFKPSQEVISYFKFLYQYSSKKEMVLLCKDQNVYNLLGLNFNFYRSPNVKCIIYNNEQDISNYLIEEKPDSVFLLERNITGESQYDGYQNSVLYCLYPHWIFHYNYFKWQSRSRIWNIRKLRKITKPSVYR